MDSERSPSSSLHRRRSRSAQLVLREAQDAFWHVMSSESAKRWREQIESKTTEVQGKVRQRTAKVSQQVREQLSHQQVVKFFDKTGFMLGVIGLTTTEFVFLRFPTFFWLWFAITIPPLIVLRWYLYTLAKYQFFLYDFCYFVQIGTFCNLFIFPESRFLWRIHFVLAQGPLLWAIPTWRNSFVFHSVDKVTSVFIHLFPALLTYIYRWETGIMCDEGQPDCHLEWSMITLFPLLYYFCWQILYILKTEVWSREMIQQDRNIITSVRWLASDKAHPLTVLTTKVCRKLRILQLTEELDPETWKTKVIFWAVQLLYTLITFFPVKLSFDHQWICILIMWLCFCTCVWNGANYYIEVFSTRYTMKFKDGAAKAKDGMNGQSDPHLTSPASESSSQGDEDRTKQGAAEWTDKPACEGTKRGNLEGDVAGVTSPKRVPIACASG